MVQGLGIDIIEIKRIRKALKKFPGFETRIFSEEELTYCKSRKSPELHFAVRFAAKEAASKALGTGIKGFSWKEIAVLRNANGKPSINLTGNAAAIARSKNITRLHLSVSFNKDLATAVVIAEK